MGDSTSETGSTSLDFIENPDGGGLYGLSCDVFAQDCPRDQKCMPWANDGGGAWNSTRCSPVADQPAQVGETCTVEGSAVSGLDDCDLGLMCFHVDPRTNEGTCVAMCEGTEEMPTCSDAARVCSQTHDGGLHLCLQPCDPIALDCPPELSCTANDVEFVCVRPGTHGQGIFDFGEECEHFVDCADGLSCIDDAAECMGRCCTQACDPMAPACMLPSQSCQPLRSAGVCVN